MNWMNEWFLSSCAEDALVVVVVVGPKTPLELYQFLDKRLLLLLLLLLLRLLLRVKSVSLLEIGDMSQTLQRSIFNKRNKEKEKKTWTNGYNSWCSGIVSYGRCNATHMHMHVRYDLFSSSPSSRHWSLNSFPWNLGHYRDQTSKYLLVHEKRKCMYLQCIC